MSSGISPSRVKTTPQTQLEGLKERFNRLSLSQLETITGFPRHQWCKWFKGRNINENSLVEAAGKINCVWLEQVTPGVLLDLIQARRHAAALMADDGYNYTPKRYERYSNAQTTGQAAAALPRFV